MSDFHQSGPVTSLPRLLQRPIDELEGRILGLVRRFPVALVIPMVPDEMDRPALARIVAELAEVAYLDTLVISLNRATAEDHPAPRTARIRVRRGERDSSTPARGAGTAELPALPPPEQNSGAARSQIPSQRGRRPSSDSYRELEVECFPLVRSVLPAPKYFSFSA